MFKKISVILFGILFCKLGITSPAQVLPRDWIVERDISLEVNSDNTSQFLNIVILRRHPDSRARTIYWGINNAGGKTIPIETFSARKASKTDLNKLLDAPQFAYDELLKSPDRFNLLFTEIQKVGQSLGQVTNESADRGLYTNDQVELAGRGTAPRVGPLKDDLKVVDRIIMQRKITMPARNWNREEQYAGALFFYPTELAWRFFSLSPASRVFKIAEFTLVDIAGNETAPVNADFIIGQPYMGFMLSNSGADTRARTMWKSSKSQ